MKKTEAELITDILQALLLVVPRPNCERDDCACGAPMAWFLGTFAGILDGVPAEYWPFVAQVPPWMRESNAPECRTVMALLRERSSRVVS